MVRSGLPPGIRQLIDPHRVYRQTELARLLGVSQRTICRWRSNGAKDRAGRVVRLHGVLTGSWRFSGQDVLFFLGRQATPAAADPAATPAREAVPVGLADEYLKGQGF